MIQINIVLLYTLTSIGSIGIIGVRSSSVTVSAFLSCTDRLFVVLHFGSFAFPMHCLKIQKTLPPRREVVKAYRRRQQQCPESIPLFVICYRSQYGIRMMIVKKAGATRHRSYFPRRRQKDTKNYLRYTCQCCMVWATSEAWMMCSRTMVAWKLLLSFLPTAPEKGLVPSHRLAQIISYLSICCCCPPVL
jgi:hypothetical protein